MSRDALLAAQTELAAALVGRGAPPPGFDLDALADCAASLRAKRRGQALGAWPSLAGSLPDAPARFDAWALAHELAPGDTPLEDGARFARWLAAKGELPDAGRLELAGFELRWRRGPLGLAPRRLAVRALRAGGRLVLALRLPGLGERWLSTPARASAPASSPPTPGPAPARATRAPDGPSPRASTAG